jgi:hypothetical protein
MQTHCLRQIQLHDIAALASRLRDADWTAVLGAPAPTERRWWAFPPLALAARYYPGAVPTEVLRELGGACPRALRFATDRAALTDVSWSNPHIHALPGIAWSRTPLDALRYVRSRALPSRSSLEEVRFALQVQPHLNQVPWYGISHGKRIARWLFSHPPRVQTMVSINAALRSLDHGEAG